MTDTPRTAAALATDEAIAAEEEALDTAKALMEPVRSVACRWLETSSCPSLRQQGPPYPDCPVEYQNTTRCYRDVYPWEVDPDD